jgi:hypothetical protein
VESSTSSSTTARAPQLLAEARKTPIDRIPEQTRAAVLSRIVTQTHLVSAAFQSSI